MTVAACTVALMTISKRLLLMILSMILMRKVASSKKTHTLDTLVMTKIAKIDILFITETA